MVTMTEISTTDKGQWTALLEQLTKDHDGTILTIEVLDATYGDLEEAQWLPFAYASYDSRDDVVIIAVGSPLDRVGYSE
jgi:hypothetical protein